MCCLLVLPYYMVNKDEYINESVSRAFSAAGIPVKEPAGLALQGRKAPGRLHHHSLALR